MGKENELLAIIKDVGIGMRDAPAPILWFDVRISECEGALQCLSWADAFELVMAAGIYDVKQLEGRPCWVVASNGMIRFKRMAKI